MGILHRLEFTILYFIHFIIILFLQMMTFPKGGFVIFYIYAFIQSDLQMRTMEAIKNFVRFSSGYKFVNKIWLSGYMNTHTHTHTRTHTSTHTHTHTHTLYPLRMEAAEPKCSIGGGSGEVYARPGPV